MESSFSHLPTVRVYHLGPDIKKDEGKPVPVSVQSGFYHIGVNYSQPYIVLIPPSITSLNERQIEIVTNDVPALNTSLAKTQNSIKLVDQPTPHLEAAHLLRGDLGHRLAVMDGPNQTKFVFRVDQTDLTCSVPNTETYLFNSWT